jgi:hypothetical protein
MKEFLSRYGFFVLTLLVGLFGLTLIYATLRKRKGTPNRRRTVLDYLLLWPIVFGSSTGEDVNKTSSDPLTKRALIGILIIIALLICAFAFNW